MTAISTYRVIGVRADGTKHVLSVRLSLEDADYVKQILLSVGIFEQVVVQSDEPEDSAASQSSVLADPIEPEPCRSDKIA